MKSTTPFVLLSMAAIGSLFIGTADALSKVDGVAPSTVKVYAHICRLG
jgi:hypothetical protein